MDKTIKEQLEAIRRSGETNMLDINMVQQIANREGFYELARFIEEHRSEYIKFIFYGDEEDTEEVASDAEIPQTPADTQDAENEAENAEYAEGVADLTDTAVHTETTRKALEYRYNLTGQKRKGLVDAISKILDLPAVYQKAPTFAYKIGEYTVSRNGTLSYSSKIHPEYAAVLIGDLQKLGFAAETTQDEAETVAVEEDGEETAGRIEAEDTVVTQDEGTLKTPAVLDISTGTEIPENQAVEETTSETDPEGDKPENLIIEIPRNTLSDTAYLNLQKIIASKATLLKQALGTKTLEIKETAEKLCFPWFTLHDGVTGEADAYTKLITAMVEMAKKQKRVVATERPLENAKFTMRIFLIRLGFVGDEYKTARKILLRNLSGNSSWRYGKPHEKPATEEASSFPPNPQEANPHIPEDASLDITTASTNTETMDTLSIPENTDIKEVSEDDMGHVDTFPEDKGGAPYDK